MDGRNDEANNRYGLRNREHSNRDGVMSIHEQGSGDNEEDEEEEEEEEEIDRPPQRRRIDEANDRDPVGLLDVPRVIDFEAFALNPEGRDGGHEENNGQREFHRDNQGQGGDGRGRTANGGGGRGGGGRGEGGRGGGGRGGEVVEKEVVEEDLMEEEVVTELLKGMQLLLSIKNAEEEVVVEEEDVEELLKITQEEGVMV